MNPYFYQKEIEHKNWKRKSRMLAVWLVLSMMISLLGGCGSGSPTASEEGQNTVTGEETSGLAGEGENGQKDTDGAGEENKPMGRYVENSVDISQYTTLSCGITQLSDGSFVILDKSAGKLVSTDGGETWQAEEIPGILDLAAFNEDNYIFTMKTDTDGTTAVLFSPSLGEDGEFHTGLILTKPDGSSQTIAELTAAEEGYVRDIWFGPDGRLFAEIIGGSALYEVDCESGEMHKYLALHANPDLLQFQGDYMILLTYQDGITFYDMNKETWVDDDVLADFMRQNCLDHYYATDTFTVYMAPGEEGIIYVACDGGNGGVYRHVIGGSAMEQIIDGALSSFGNPSMSIVSMVPLDNNEFMVLFSGGKLVRYTYDPNVPTVPDDLVTVYSLQEEDKVRQAIAQYQAQNPQAFVRYEVGLSGSDAASREDAIKKLNTELMSGAGPDILILDGLPVDSYIEKGVLLDLNDHISQMSGEQELLPNIVESFRKDGKIYSMPVTFTIPAVFGRKEDLAQIHDMASLTETVERLRRENPGQEIIGMFAEEAAVKWLMPVSGPAFVDEAGNLDGQVISDYLENMNRIYAASQEGLSEAMVKSYADRREMYHTAGIDDYYTEAYNSIGNATMELGMGDSVFAAGNLNSTYIFWELVSLNRIEGLTDMQVAPLDGHCSHVFVPDVMTGINASSAHMEEAAAFFDMLMGKEVQELFWDGFVVNRAALQSQLSPGWVLLANGGMNVDYGEVSSTIGSSMEDGREYTMSIYMPTKEEFQELYDTFCELDTPYIKVPVVEDAIVEFGGQYLEGYLSLEEAVEKIKGKVDIYMAE